MGNYDYNISKEYKVSIMKYNKLSNAYLIQFHMKTKCINIYFCLHDFHLPFPFSVKAVKYFFK